MQLNLKNRAKIILQAASGITNSQIRKSLGIGRESVIRWRSRYASSYELLVKVEAEEPRRVKQAITDILSDVQRPGAPATFTDTQKAEIIAWFVLTPKNLDSRQNQDVKTNIERLVPHIWISTTEDTKYSIGAKFGVYRNNADVDRKNATEKFLEIVTGLK